MAILLMAIGGYLLTIIDGYFINDYFIGDY
jgi:hypothetical protein